MADKQSVYMRGTGGGIFLMDVPTAGNALELWEQQIAKGELVPVDNVVAVVRGDGSTHYEQTTTDEAGNPPAPAASEQPVAEPAAKVVKPKSKPAAQQ